MIGIYAPIRNFSFTNRKKIPSIAHSGSVSIIPDKRYHFTILLSIQVRTVNPAIREWRLAGQKFSHVLDYTQFRATCRGGYCPVGTQGIEPCTITLSASAHPPARLIPM